MTVITGAADAPAFVHPAATPHAHARTVVAPRRRPSVGATLTGKAHLDWVLVAFRNRHLLDAMIRRDIAARYRGSVLGVAWLVGIPLVMMLTYTFVFGGIFKVKFEGIDRATAALSIWCGVFMWQVLGETLSRSVSILHDNVPYVKRVPFPLALLPLMPLGTALVGASVSLGLFVVAYLALSGIPPLTWFLLPFAVLPFALIAAGAAWILSSLGAFVKDLKHVVPLAMNLMMFLTPVLYPLSAVPPTLSWFVRLNPLTYPFETMRAILVAGVAPQVGTLCVQTALAAAFAALGYFLFTYREWEYADVV